MTTATTQNLKNLAKGNEVRIACASYAARVHAGEITLAEAFLECDLPIRLDRLVLAKANHMRQRLRDLCAQAGLWQDLSYYRVAGPRISDQRPLTDRERQALHDVFEEAGL